MNADIIRKMAEVTLSGSTSFTNTFPILREALDDGERRPVQVAWIVAPELTASSQMQAYTKTVRAMLSLRKSR